jgi:hypothetical protein
MLKVSTFRFPVVGRIFAGRKSLARTLQQPVPDAPSLLVERIFELLNSLPSEELPKLPAWRHPSRRRVFACAAFYRPPANARSLAETQTKNVK